MHCAHRLTGLRTPASLFSKPFGFLKSFLSLLPFECSRPRVVHYVSSQGLCLLCSTLAVALN
jgi:hypothetical protein